MTGGLRYETGREMPPGMQELAAVKIAQQLTDAAPVAAEEVGGDVPHMEYICHLCGKPTNNTSVIGTIAVHFCDACNAQIAREVAWQSLGRTYGEHSVICPFCRHELDRRDTALLEDGETQGWECECCHRLFDIATRMVRLYSTARSVTEMPKDWQPPEEDRYSEEQRWVGVVEDD